MPGDRRGLGRGLEALIPSTPGVTEVEVDSIAPNPRQPRQALDPQALEELATSIREQGLVQPLVVTQVAGGYQLLVGERRWRAAKLAGLDLVPVVVRDVTPQQMLELALVENLQREDLNPLEHANAYSHKTEGRVTRTYRTAPRAPQTGPGPRRWFGAWWRGKRPGQRRGRSRRN